MRAESMFPWICWLIVILGALATAVLMARLGCYGLSFMALLIPLCTGIKNRDDGRGSEKEYDDAED
jgi:hypothetical protein